MAWGRGGRSRDKGDFWGHSLAPPSPPSSAAAWHGRGFLEDKWEMEVQKKRSK